MARLGQAGSASLDQARGAAFLRRDAIDAFWVVDFPLLEAAGDDNPRPIPREQNIKGRAHTSMPPVHFGLSAAHHPFTSSGAEDWNSVLGPVATSEYEASMASLGERWAAARAEGDDTAAELCLSDAWSGWRDRRRKMLACRARAYDLVANGWELGGGSVRVHDADQQEHQMRSVLGLSEELVRSFEHLLRALRHGAPPHAGIAFGLDRMVALFADAPSLRDVLAFPKSSTGQDLLVKAPS